MTALRLATVIETPRLVLRVPGLGEFDAWCAYMADEEAARFIGGVQSPSQVWRMVMAMAGAWALEGFAMFSVFEKASGRWVGRVGPWRPCQWPGSEVGWGIVREAWGKGYAFEASLAAMDFAVDELGWSDIVHLIHVDNVRSARLARRLGSSDLGPCRMPPPYAEAPVSMWGQSAADWRSRRGELWAGLGR